MNAYLLELYARISVKSEANTKYLDFIFSWNSGQYFNFKLLDGNEVTLVHLKENVTDFIWLIQHNPQNLRILGHFKMTKVLFLQHF